MSLTLELRGFDKFREFCRKFPLKACIVLDEFSNEASKLIAKKAKQKAPVKSGRLRESIKAINERVEVRAYYGKHVEYGTKKMKARPFFRPAILEVIASLRSILTDKIKHMFRSELR